MSGDTKTKTYSGYLLIDWREDDLRFRKTKPSDHSPHEIPMKVEVEVNVPQYDTPTLAAEVDVPRTQVAHAAYGDIVEADGEGPPWADTVWDILEENETVDEVLYGDADREDVLDQLVGHALREVEGYPDPDDIRDYIDDWLQQSETEVTA